VDSVAAHIGAAAVDSIARGETGVLMGTLRNSIEGLPQTGALADLPDRASPTVRLRRLALTVSSGRYKSDPQSSRATADRSVLSVIGLPT